MYCQYSTTVYSVHYKEAEVLENLKCAVNNGDDGVVKDILSNQRFSRNPASYDLMMLALSKGHSNVFFKLFDYCDKSILKFERCGQNTLLHYAANLENEKAVELLLKHSEDLFVVNEKNETPLHVAAKNDNKNILNTFLKHFMDYKYKYRNTVDSDGLSVFHILCIGQNLSNVVDFLQHTSVSIDDKVLSSSKFYPGYTALHFAITHYRLNTVKFLIEHGAKLDVKTSVGLTPLHLACRMDDVMWMLYEAAPDLSSKSSNKKLIKKFESNLNIILQNRKNLIKMLFESKCDIMARDKNGNNILMYVFPYNYDICIESFLFKVLKVKRGDIPLFLSGTFDRVKSLTFKMFCEKCDNSFRYSNIKNISGSIKQLVNSRNNFGYNCVHNVSSGDKFASYEVIMFLLKCVTDINIFTNNYDTFLHLATKHCSDVVLLVVFTVYTNCKLEQFVNIDAQDNFGNTPLHYAYVLFLRRCRSSHQISELLKYGADFNIENEYGTSVLYEAISDIMKIVSKDEFFSKTVRCYNNTVTGLDDDDFNDDELVISHRVQVQVTGIFWNHLKKLQICNYLNNSFYKDFLENVSTKLHVNEESITSRNEYVKKCEQEIDRIKEIHIDKFTTLQDVLNRNINKVVSYVKNDALRKIIESPDFDEQFPEYGYTLKARCARALARASLFEEATNALKYIIRSEMPESCLEHILSFLSEKKLRDLIEVNKHRQRDNVNSDLQEDYEPCMKKAKIR